MNVNQGKSLPRLSIKQIEFCYYYLLNGGNAAKTAKQLEYASVQSAYSHLKSPMVQRFIKYRIRKMADKLEKAFDYKIRKLTHIIEKCAPDDAQTYKEMSPSAAIAAISERNKMEGHYSADKLESPNVAADSDIKKTVELTEKYVEANERDS